MLILKSIKLVCDKKCIKENLLKYKVIFENKAPKIHINTTCVLHYNNT